MDEPLRVIPLEYSRGEAPKRPGKWFLIFIAWEWFITFVAYNLIWMVDVESVMVTGPIIMLFAIVFMVLAAMKSYRLGMMIAVSYLLICTLLFALVNLLHWSPDTAFVPFLIIGGLFLVLSFLLSLIASLVLIGDSSKLSPDRNGLIK